MNGKGKEKRKRPGWGRQAPERAGAGAPKPPAGGLHFTIGTGPSFDESTQQLTPENNARLPKARLLYTDRVKLARAPAPRSR